MAPTSDPAASDRRRAERRATGGRAAQALLRQIVARLADGIVVVSADGVIRFANPASERLFGRPADELVGTEFGFPLTPGESTEIEVVRPAGTLVAVELRRVEAEWDGEPAVLVSLRDVTDRREAEERSRQLERERHARAEAEAASRAKSEFLAVMSHELRTPLNAVLGYAELLDLGVAGTLSDEARSHVARIRQSGAHLLGLVNELLDLARVEAGRLAVDHGSFDAREVAEASLVLVQPDAEAKGLTLRGPSEAPAGLAFHGDRDRVRQILANLLSNAVKFTEAGGEVTLSVGESSEPDAGAHLRGGERWAFFRVRDSGVGIAPEQLDAIFAPFVQAEGGHTRRRDGSGLGLTISRRLARLMGGDVAVRSRPGEGSEFTLWLPAVSGERARAAAERVATPVAPVSAFVSRDARPDARAFGDAADALVCEAEAVLDAFVARLRHEASMPAGARLKYSQLADHAAALIADIATTLVAIEEAEGQPSPLVAESLDIQRYIADRHGAQRARLGWTAEAIAREYVILGEELERAVHRRVGGASGEAAGGSRAPSGPASEAIVVIRRFLEEARETSRRALERAASTASDARTL